MGNAVEAAIRGVQVMRGTRRCTRPEAVQRQHARDLFNFVMDRNRRGIVMCQCLIAEGARILPGTSQRRLSFEQHHGACGCSPCHFAQLEIQQGDGRATPHGQVR